MVGLGKPGLGGERIKKTDTYRNSGVRRSVCTMVAMAPTIITIRNLSVFIILCPTQWVGMASHGRKSLVFEHFRAVNILGEEAVVVRFFFHKQVNCL